MTCPFCNLEAQKVVDADDLVVCILDKYPVTEGHRLIIPRRHVASYFDLTDHEQHAIGEMLKKARASLDEQHQPQGYNIGINIGRAAGQTIDHVHVHLIPRYEGDMKNPRGGVRGVIPEKQRYPSD